MLRKVTLAIAAVATIGAAALVPTTASASWKGKYWGGYSYGHGYGYNNYYSYSAPRYVSYDYSCWRKYWVDTAYGPVLKKVWVCNYSY